MPFTPFHFGAHACAALLASKKINILVFVLANVIIDIEPLLVMVFNFAYPLHGYAHTFLGASVIGFLWAVLAYKFRSFSAGLFQILRMEYKFNFKQYVFSGIGGSLLHVLFDAPLYQEIYPFYPLKINPFYNIISPILMYQLCAFLFLPAVIMYVFKIKNYKNGIMN